ncbi:hypothetical protein AA0121_g2784 [Alternaria tenuissima]|nr:hypothetical protein AA0121_g2784 [Alternaria tenuissima]
MAHGEPHRKHVKVPDKKTPRSSTGESDYTHLKRGKYTWSIPSSNISSLDANTVSESLIDDIAHHGIFEPSPIEMRRQMGKIVAWNEIKEKVTEEEFRKIDTGTIIWEITAEKTTNEIATYRNFDYVPTPDGLYCLKGAPWIIEVVNKESWSYDCKRMTQHEKRGDEKLTASQLTQTVRLLYPDGKNTSNVRNLPVLSVGWCKHPLTGDGISLVSLNESKTIRATKGMFVVGELDQSSKLAWLDMCHRSKTEKLRVAREKLEAARLVDSAVPNPPTEVEQTGFPSPNLLVAKDISNHTAFEQFVDSGLGSEAPSPPPDGYLNAAEPLQHGERANCPGYVESARSLRLNSV